jgi:hypothetical protein
VGIDVTPKTAHDIICVDPDSGVWVAVLSSPAFDARTVEPSSLTFGRTGDEQSLVGCHD